MVSQMVLLDCMVVLIGVGFWLWKWEHRRERQRQERKGERERERDRDRGERDVKGNLGEMKGRTLCCSGRLSMSLKILQNKSFKRKKERILLHMLSGLFNKMFIKVHKRPRAGTSPRVHHQACVHLHCSCTICYQMLIHLAELHLPLAFVK